MRGYVLAVLLALLAAAAPAAALQNACAPVYAQSGVMEAGAVYTNSITAPLGATDLVCSCVPRTAAPIDPTPPVNPPAYIVRTSSTIEGTTCTCAYEFPRTTPAGTFSLATCALYK